MSHCNKLSKYFIKSWIHSTSIVWQDFREIHYTATQLTQGSQYRPMYVYHQSPTCWNNEFVGGAGWEEITYRNMAEGLLSGAEILACAILARLRALRARTLEHSAQPLGGSVNWRLSFPSDLVGLNLFQAAQLDPVSSRQLVWSRGLFWSLACLRATLSSFTVYCGIEELSEYDQIQGHSEAILVDFLPV